MAALEVLTIESERIELRPADDMTGKPTIQGLSERIRPILLGGMLVLLSSVDAPLALGAIADPGARVDIKSIDAFLERTVARNRIPGLSVAVIQDDRILLCKGYGQAGGGRPLTPSTQLYLGSATKSITALAVLQLVEQGRVELDAPVRRYLPWFRVADEAASRLITIRHLLNHTSGLSEGADPGNFNLSPTLDEQIRALRSARLTAPVGARYQYDSQNYRTLGLVVERASGQSYGDYVRDHIFAPLEMNRSVAGSGEIPRLAQGHSYLFGLPFPREEQYQPASQSSGYIASTAEGMGHFLIAMLNGGRFAGRSVIREDTIARMLTPPEAIESDYGFGWLVSTVSAVTGSAHTDRIAFHGGSLPNYQAFALLLPEKRLGFVYLCNQNGIVPMLTWSRTLKSGMVGLLLGDPAPPSASCSWIGWLVAALAVVTLGLQVRGISRLRKWARRVSLQSGPVRWARTLADLVAPVLVFTFIGWRQPWTLLPDVTLWAAAACALSLARGAGKLFLMVQCGLPSARRRTPLN